MVLYILIGTLAAIGMLSVLWVCFGWLLPGGRDGAVICLGWPRDGMIARYRWLRDLGLLHCPMIIVMEEPVGADAMPMGPGIEICSPDALWQRLKQERTNLDGTGNGDSPGRHQRRGISEL